MKIVWLHGLDSPTRPDRAGVLSEFGTVLTPEVDYRDPTVYEFLYNTITEFAPDLIGGCSMGGYFAYHIANRLGVNTLLVNPALVTRSIETNVTECPAANNHHEVYLGINDTHLNPWDTVSALNKDNASAVIHFVDMGHRTDNRILLAGLHETERTLRTLAA